jgi:hypothetical protein
VDVFVGEGSRVEIPRSGVEHDWRVGAPGYGSVSYDFSAIHRHHRWIALVDFSRVRRRHDGLRRKRVLVRVRLVEDSHEVALVNQPLNLGGAAKELHALILRELGP